MPLALVVGQLLAVARAKKPGGSGQDSQSDPPGGIAIQALLQIPDARDGHGDRLVIDTGQQVSQ